MIEKNKPIEIPKGNIFQNDKLNREKPIEGLSYLIKSTTDGFTICINGQWGSGKTTFLRLWQRYLEERMNIKSIYFNAWENDFASDPLVALLGEINLFIKEYFPNQKGNLDKLKNLGKNVLKSSLPFIIKTLIQYFVKIDADKIKEVIEVLAENTVENLIEEYEGEKNIIEEFRETLGEILNEIDSKPLVIFIDELDRCRPLYAIETLERIKHVFEMEGLIFVLALDKKQLAESIKSQYGNIDAENYLKRFIDLEFDLPNNIENTRNFINYLMKKYKIPNILISKRIRYDIRTLMDLIVYWCNLLGFSIRDIEQSFMDIYLLLSMLPDGKIGEIMPAVVFFVLFRRKRYNLFVSFLNQEKSAEMIIEEIFKNRDMLIFNEEEISNVASIYWLEAKTKAYLLSAFKTNEEIDNLIKTKEKQMENLEDKEEHIVFNYILDFLKKEYGIDYKINSVVNYAINHVDFLSNFH